MAIISVRYAIGGLKDKAPQPAMVIIMYASEWTNRTYLSSSQESSVNAGFSQKRTILINR